MHVGLFVAVCVQRPVDTGPARLGELPPARPEGIATGLIIAAIIVIAIVLSQLLTQTARRRGVVL